MPQMSNPVIVEVKKDETSVQTLNDSKIKIVTINHQSYLTGLLKDDEIGLFNSSGQLLAFYKATSDVERINFTGVVLIKIKSGNHYTILKSIS
jgi:hypothetical protein